MTRAVASVVGRRLPAACAVAFTLVAACAHAAGGHHSVDDAVILEPGQCELETWVSRSSAGQQLAHAGPGCRVGPVELSGVLEHAMQPSARLASVQLKAVQGLARGWSVGGAVTLGAARGPVAHSRGLLLLATWAADPWAVHLNLGRDWIGGRPALAHAGASVEWLASAQVQAIVERYEERGAGFVRAGLRFMPTTTWQLDLSHATRLHGPAPAGLWTLGSTWQFGG